MAGLVNKLVIGGAIFAKTQEFNDLAAIAEDVKSPASAATVVQLAATANACVDSINGIIAQLNALRASLGVHNDV